MIMAFRQFFRCTFPAKIVLPVLRFWRTSLLPLGLVVNVRSEKQESVGSNLAQTQNVFYACKIRGDFLFFGVHFDFFPKISLIEVISFLAPF